MIFDTHAHYDDKAFEEDRVELLTSLPDNGIGNVVNVCASINSLKRILPLTEAFPYVWVIEEFTYSLLYTIYRGLHFKRF